MWCCMWGRGLRGNNIDCSALSQLSGTSSATHRKIGPFWCWFLDGWFCVHSRTPQVSPTNSPMRPGIPPDTTIPQIFSVRGFEALFPRAGTLGCMVCLTPQLFLPVYPHTNVGPRSLPAATLPTSVLLARNPLRLCCLSLPLLLDWMNVSSLTPWWSDFYTVLFSGSSGCFLFFNLLLSFFWLCEEAKCIYLHLHLGQKSVKLIFKEWIIQWHE